MSVRNIFSRSHMAIPLTIFGISILMLIFITSCGMTNEEFVEEASARLTATAEARNEGEAGSSGEIEITPTPEATTPPDGQFGQSRQWLTVKNDGVWSSTVIPVCWENSSQDNQQGRQWVEDAVSRTWESFSAIDFVGWGQCENSSPGIRIIIEDSEDAPHVDKLGSHLDGEKEGMSLNFTFQNWPCNRSIQDCIEIIAIHEFGHALGFAHEQSRQDAPFNCQVLHQGTSDDLLDITPYDLNSVMNYCNPQWSGNGNLSLLDIEGVQRVYGPPLGTSPTVSIAAIVLYKENNPDYQTDLPVCVINVTGSDVVDFTQDSACPNDDVRSLILRDMPSGLTIRVFDNSEGKRDDDWAEINIKRDITTKNINTFETSFEDDDVNMIYHRDDNLDGKISRLVVSATTLEATLDLYEGNNAEQNLVCSILLQSFIVATAPDVEPVLDFTNDHVDCSSDEARSLVLHNAPQGITFRLFDNSKGDPINDDWVEITTKRMITRKVIGSFERSFEDDDVIVTFHGSGNLDGKVSRFEFGERRNLVEFYEGNNGSQDLVCRLTTASTRTIDFTDSSQCDNDEARSLILLRPNAGLVIRVYDDSGCRSSEDDWTVIEVLQSADRIVVDTFERSTSSSNVSVRYRTDGNLDGKVSCIEIVP